MSHYDNFIVYIQNNTSQEEHYHSSTGYTDGNHIHYGLTAPQMREFIKIWYGENKTTLEYGEWKNLLNALYHGKSFEERAMASMVMSRFPKFRLQLSLETLDVWLSQLVGWAEVDSTCQMVFTDKDFDARWDEWKLFLRELYKDENINKRRASIVLLIKPIRDTEEKRFFNLGIELVDVLKVEKDKLITKAISWILRESIKQHREDVAQYVAENKDSLPAIAVREFRKKFETGRK